MALLYSLDNDNGGKFAIDSATGVISRKSDLTPGATYSVTVRVTDTATGRFTGFTDKITAVDNRIVISGVPGKAYSGVAFSFTPTVTNAKGSISWSIAGSVPDGLSFSTATGTLSGKPTTAGSNDMTISATDSVRTSTLAVTVTVAAVPPAPANSTGRDPVNQFANYKAAKAAGTRLLVVFEGDSTFAGVTGTNGETDYLLRSPAAYAAAALSNGTFETFAGDYGGGTTDSGSKSPPNADTRVSLGGSAAWATPEAVGGKSIRLNAVGDSANFVTGRAFNRVRVGVTTDAGVFDLSINGTPLNQPITQNTGRTSVFEFTIPDGVGVAGAKVSVVSQQAASFNVWSIECYDTTKKTIDCYNGGRGGQQSNAYGGDTGYQNPIDALLALKPTLTFINLGINDGDFGVTKAQYKANIDAQCAKLIAIKSDIILVVPTPCNTGVGSEGTWTDRRDALLEIGAARGLLVVDLHARYTDWATQNAKSPPWITDTRHPKALLYADEGQFFASILAVL